MDFIPQKFGDLISAAQGVAISVAFLYITFKIPNMLYAWIAGQKELAQIQAEKEDRVEKSRAAERESDRVARHEVSDRFQKIIFDMLSIHDKVGDKITEALQQLRLTTATLCHFQSESEGKKPHPQKQGTTPLA